MEESHFALSPKSILENSICFFIYLSIRYLVIDGIFCGSGGLKKLCSVNH